MSNIRTYEITHSKQKLLSIKQKDSTDYLLGGSLVMQNGTIDKFLFEGGYAQVRTAANNFEFYYYNQDHLGNNREVVDANGKIRQTTNYYAFGMISEESSSSKQPYKYNGKELDRMHGLDTYDYGARQYDPILARWDRMDRRCEKYYNVSPYSYCANNPVMLVDPDGNAWKPTQGEKGSPTGYIWVDEADSYNEDGSLKAGLYHQAIFFSATGKNGKTFNPNSKKNMGTSIATVYKADGTTVDFDACTYPSDIDAYPTIPEKMLEAKVGTHHGSKRSYTALRMSDVGTTDFYSSEIDLGFVSPSTGRTYAQGVNVHLPGADNFTGIDSKGNAISKACFTIDQYRWDEFMSIFNNPSQRNNVISISVSRSLGKPTNYVPYSPKYKIPSTIYINLV